MKRDDIEAEIANDPPQIQEAVRRGIAAAYGSFEEAEYVFSGHVYEVIEAVRAAIRPLLN